MYYGTTSVKLSEIASVGLDNSILVCSKAQAEKQAEEEAAKIGGKPVILKILVDSEVRKNKPIGARKILICN